ncbi:hypothetical protein Tco_0009605 [Tanacetum coccineum]
MKSTVLTIYTPYTVRKTRLIIEYSVKISKKARILELKRRHLKITILTSNTPYPSRKIRRIRACTSQKTMKETRSIRRIHQGRYGICSVCLILLFYHNGCGDKHPKNKEKGSSIGGDVFMDQVFSKNAKVVWDETYSKQDAYVIFNMHNKIYSLSQSGLTLSEYYHKSNALWRQYDSLVNLPDCICENSDKLKKHNKLLKLMLFLIRLNKVYAPIRSIILTTDPIPDVKGTFATFSRDKFHRSTQSHNVSKTGNGNSAFIDRTNSRSNNWSNYNNNQFKRLNKPNLVCTHCNMNGHTADRCFKLLGYPSNFKKRNGTNQGCSSNSVISCTKDQPSVSSKTFTDEQYKRLMALINEKSRSGSIPANVAGASQHMTYTIINMFNVVDVSKLNMIVGHLNGTKVVVTHIDSLMLIDKITINNDSVLRTQVGTGSESNGTMHDEVGCDGSAHAAFMTQNNVSSPVDAAMAYNLGNDDAGSSSFIK